MKVISYPQYIIMNVTVTNMIQKNDYAGENMNFVWH